MQVWTTYLDEYKEPKNKQKSFFLSLKIFFKRFVLMLNIKTFKEEE